MTAPDAATTLYPDWTEIAAEAERLAALLRGSGPWTGLVAITRGGLFPAGILSHRLPIRRVETLGLASYQGRARGPLRTLALPEQAVADRGAGWLVVDDLADSGATAARVRELLPEARLAALYAKPLGRDSLDTYVTEVPQATWIVFPWEAAAS